VPFAAVGGVVQIIARDIGFDAVNSGSLKNARLRPRFRVVNFGQEIGSAKRVRWSAAANDSARRAQHNGKSPKGQER